MKTKDRRRELRLSKEDEALITEAAALSGTTFTGFVLEEAVARAREIVDAHRNITFAGDAYARLLEALDAPPEKNPALVELAKRARRFRRARRCGSNDSRKTHDRAGFRCGNERTRQLVPPPRPRPPKNRTPPGPSFSSTTPTGSSATTACPWAASPSADAPRRLTRGLPRYPVPLVLLARLAIDETEHGKGLGMSLLFEALHRASLAAEHAAARLIAVDPIDDNARRFYLRWGFQPVDDDPTGRLFVRTRDALASFPTDYSDPPPPD